MKKYLIFVILILNLNLFSQSQIEKYWYYRKRLTDYFVKVGPNLGESIVAEWLNDEHMKKYKIGDKTTYFVDSKNIDNSNDNSNRLKPYYNFSNIGFKLGFTYYLNL